MLIQPIILNIYKIQRNRFKTHESDIDIFFI
jgi:hypothetical protein